MKHHILNLYYRVLGYLARHYIKKTKPIIIGINGSVGKTSCRTIVAQSLKTLLPAADIYTSPKNFNGELGMSLSIFRIEKYNPGVLGLLQALFIACKKCLISTKAFAYPSILILEYGIDHPGEMAFLLSIVKPDYTIHTQIDSVHSLQFGNPDIIAQEEFLLEQHTRNTVFLNTDDPYLHHTQGRIPCDVISYSASKKNTMTTICIGKENTDIYKIPQQASVKKDDNTLQSEIITFNGKKRITLSINLLGSYHLAYAAVGTCLADMIAYRLYQKEAFMNGATISLNLSLQAGRRSIFEGIEKSIIIDSTYNASPRSVQSIIQETLQRSKQNKPEYKNILVLGEMRELGGEEKKAHEELAQFLMQYTCPLFLVGEAMNTTMKEYFAAHGAGELTDIYYFTNYADVGESLKNYIINNTTQPHLILFKGSQNTIFLEEAIKYVLANKEDEQKLTRQGARWAAKKQEFLTKALQHKQETL